MIASFGGGKLQSQVDIILGRTHINIKTLLHYIAHILLKHKSVKRHLFEFYCQSSILIIMVMGFCSHKGGNNWDPPQSIGLPPTPSFTLPFLQEFSFKPSYLLIVSTREAKAHNHQSQPSSIHRNGLFSLFSH